MRFLFAYNQKLLVIYRDKGLKNLWQREKLKRSEMGPSRIRHTTNFQPCVTMKNKYRNQRLDYSFQRRLDILCTHHAIFLPAGEEECVTSPKNACVGSYVSKRVLENSSSTSNITHKNTQQIVEKYFFY